MSLFFVCFLGFTLVMCVVGILARYCTTVRVTSNVGLSASFVSDGFALYQSAPTVVVLFDGPQGIDANVQVSFCMCP